MRQECCGEICGALPEYAVELPGMTFRRGSGREKKNETRVVEQEFGGGASSVRKRHKKCNRGPYIFETHHKTLWTIANNLLVTSYEWSWIYVHEWSFRVHSFASAYGRSWGIYRPLGLQGAVLFPISFRSKTSICFFSICLFSRLRSRNDDATCTTCNIGTYRN